MIDLTSARDKAARELCTFVADYFDKDPESFPIDKGVQRIIDAFLAQLKQDGVKLVKREASEEMLDSAVAALERHTSETEYSTPLAVWYAMWDRAPEVTP